MSAFLTAILANKIYTGIAAVLLTSAAGPILRYLLSKIPIDKLKEKTGKVFFKLGAFVSGFLGNRVPYLKKVYESAVEPWVILVLETLVTNCLVEFIRGLRSDND